MTNDEAAYIISKLLITASGGRGNGKIITNARITHALLMAISELRKNPSDGCLSRRTVDDVLDEAYKTKNIEKSAS